MSSFYYIIYNTNCNSFLYISHTFYHFVQKITVKIGQLSPDAKNPRPQMLAVALEIKSPHSKRSEGIFCLFSFWVRDSRLLSADYSNRRNTLSPFFQGIEI